MRKRNRIALISLLVLSSGTAAAGVNYTGGDARDANLAARRGGDRAVQSQANGEQLRGHEPLPMALRPAADNATREKKTLAVLLLMLRNGPGAR
jgi:hypothetical protein